MGLESDAINMHFNPPPLPLTQFHRLHINSALPVKWQTGVFYNESSLPNLAEVSATCSRVTAFVFNCALIPTRKCLNEAVFIPGRFTSVERLGCAAVWRCLSTWDLPKTSSAMLQFEKGGINKVVATLYSKTPFYSYTEKERNDNNTKNTF